MKFNAHSALEGKHAFLSPSTYHWTNYDEQKLTARFHSAQSAARGTKLHEFAHSAISLGIKQADERITINLYINDALRYGMQPEQPLFYSYNCFGTADAIVLDGTTLRIFDLKNGITKSNVRQLEVYAALFCLEYKHDPFGLSYDLRIYQNDDVIMYEGDPEVIAQLMDTIVQFDAYLEQLKGDD